MWFKNQYPKYIYKMYKNQTVKHVDVNIDNLMVDMNGIFHNSAQKIYKYGNFKPQKSFINNIKSPEVNAKTQLLLFQDVCETIEKLVNITSPSKRVILCVDGPAPISKQNQQRQRRFRTAKESSGATEGAFDSNCITPGTKFMDNLSKYIDWWIRKKISEDSKWQELEIIFSNEKVPGEGEHKGIRYIRENGIKDESFCINGLDADLIMLALGTHLPKFYIVREDLYDHSVEYLCIDVGSIHSILAESMRWESSDHKFDANTAIEDFIFLCFIVGNDFLPHIPSIEIIQGGIELIINIYKKIGTFHGHITHKNVNGDIKFVPKALSQFFEIIGNSEKENFEAKLREKFIRDPLLEKCSTKDAKGIWSVNISLHNSLYWEDKFPRLSMEQICHEYLEGMQWVLTYYTKDVPDWKWHYAHHYAPPASILAKYFMTYKHKEYSMTVPSTPFQQLLCVLPPKSAKLIPVPLCNLLTDDDSPLKKHCPETFEIDYAGKKKEWEGIVLLPIVDFTVIRKNYFNVISQVSALDLKRNILGRSFSYDYRPNFVYTFNSYYGTIENCKVITTMIDI
jgi:5'-3' exonuclease